MTRPLLLDLFCGAGGAAMGYHRSGFDVIGVDVVEQPNYPFEFIRADAIRFAQSCQRYGWNIDGRPIAARHASPPCQSSSALTKGTNRLTRSHLHESLIEPTRELLQMSALPYVIENVQGSKIRRDLTLCGEMFGLDVIRHRYFECSFPVVVPTHVAHRGRVAGWRHGEYFDGPYRAVYGDGGGKGTVDEWRDAMGIDWMGTKLELAESIPPAYTEYVGAQLLDALRDDDDEQAS